ncbi:TRAP transporter small permease [Deferrisoma palaeochoriense]
MSGEERQPTRSWLSRLARASGQTLNFLEEWCLILCVAALSILLIANVIARAFSKSLYYAEEISEFLVILTTFVGLSYGVRKGRHIRMGALLDLMPAAVEKVFIIIISTVSAAVMFVMARESYAYLMMALNRGHLSPALHVPFWIFYVIVPVGFAIAGVQYIRTIIINLKRRETWISPDQQSEYEDIL